jgi:colicin import membrane protein
MKETRADTRVAFLQAVGMHAVLFALMLAGLHWTRSNVVDPPRGDVIEADLIDPSALSASMRRALQRDPKELPKPVVQPEPVPPEPVPDPIPEPLPKPVVDELPPPPIREPDRVDQEKVQRDADAPDPAQVQREQEAMRRQQQADLDAEREKKLAEIRKQREQAAREVTRAEQRAQQLADARAQQQQSKAPPPGDPNSRALHNASYIAAIQAAILRQWTRPESVLIGQQCQVRILQIPGGEVVDVQVSPSCPYDALGRRSVEAAVRKASPLPYAGYEDVFVRDPVFTFRAEDQ